MRKQGWNIIYITALENEICILNLNLTKYAQQIFKIVTLKMHDCVNFGLPCKTLIYFAQWDHHQW